MNKITKAGISGLAIISSAALLAGCAGGTTEPTEPTEPSFLACGVSDEGSWSDRSFNQAAYEGLEKAKAEIAGVDIKGFESHGPSDFGPNLDQAVADGCDVIFAVGFNFSDGSLSNAVTEHAESHFVWIDGWNEGWENLKPISYKMAESSYLSGYLAAAYSKTGVVATYGGMDIPAVTDFMLGFENGAHQYGLDSGKSITVLPWQFVGDFGNTQVAKSISDGFIADNADVIFPVAGSLFTATYESIKESGKDVVFMGVDKDVALTSPEYADLTLTSVEKRMTQAVFDVVKDLSGGAAFTTTDYVGTLANDGTGLSDFYAFDSKVDSALKAKLDELKAAIIAGTIDPTKDPR